ncbi:MAG: hypothetical protein Q6K80_12300 [Thermostichus sp. DG_1_6_bins_120]
MVDAVPVQRYDLFVQASRLLQCYRQLTPELRPVGLEVALAIQYHRAQSGSRCLLPWVGSPHGLPLQQVAQRICDPFYTKSHPLLPTLPGTGEPLVWPLFNQSENGLVRPLAPSTAGGKLAERRWLKGCNSQEGIGCHALAAHLWQDERFLAEDRDLCPFRLYDGRYPLSVDQGRQTCGFDDHPCGWQPGHPKMLQVVGKGKQAEILLPQWTDAMWAMLLPAHRPLPVYPLLVMLYFGQETLQKGRSSVSLEQFRQDFQFSPAQFRLLFDACPEHPLNRHLLTRAAQPEMHWESAHLSQMPPLLHQPAGGKVVLDPDEPPQFRSSGIPHSSAVDPMMAERRRRRQLERSERHNQILHHFRRWFRLAGLEVREDQHTFDFLAVAEGHLLLAEVKLLYHKDAAESLQEVVGQLLYYERFALTPWIEQGFSVQKAAVFDAPPPDAYISFLASLGIATYWINEQQMIDGPEESLRLLRQMEVRVRPDPELGD